jgi:hypothetical protein
MDWIEQALRAHLRARALQNQENFSNLITETVKETEDPHQKTTLDR